MHAAVCCADGRQEGPRKLLAVLVHKHLVPLAAATPATHAAAVHALAGLAGSPTYVTFAEDVDAVLANGVRAHPVRSPPTPPDVFFFPLSLRN